MKLSKVPTRSTEETRDIVLYILDTNCCMIHTPAIDTDATVEYKSGHDIIM
jgi:hypothetical protein